MGEVWARPRGASSLGEDEDADSEQNSGSSLSRRGGRRTVRLDSKAAQAADGGGSGGGDGGGATPGASERDDDFQARWRRVRRAWQKRDEVAQLGSRLGQAARRGTSRAARSVRWNRVGKEWTRVGDSDAAEDNHRSKLDGQQGDQQQGGQQAVDARGVWAECARLGQEWTSRRSRTGRGSTGADEEGLLGGDGRGEDHARRLMVSAPVSPTGSATPSPGHSPRRGRRGSLGDIQPVRGQAGFTWGSAVGSTLSRRTSLDDSDDEGLARAGQHGREEVSSLWSEFRQGMASMLQRLEPAARPAAETRPLLSAGEP